MPDNIVDVDAFTDPVQAPADGDDASEPIIQAAPQALANRTRNLKNRLDTAVGRLDSVESSGNIALASGKTVGATNINATAAIISSLGKLEATAGKVRAGDGFEHVTAKSVVAMATGVVVGGGFSVPGPGAGSDIGVVAIGENDPTNGMLKIPIPHLATVTRIRALAACSTTPSAVGMELQFRRVRHDKVAPFGVGTLSSMWTVGKTTSGDTLLDSNSDGTFNSLQIDRSTDTFECAVIGGEDGGNTCDNRIKWIELTYTMPGPVER